MFTGIILALKYWEINILKWSIFLYICPVHKQPACEAPLQYSVIIHLDFRNVGQIFILHI